MSEGRLIVALTDVPKSEATFGLFTSLKCKNQFAQFVLTKHH